MSLVFGVVAAIDLGSGDDAARGRIGAYALAALAAVLTSRPVFRHFQRIYGSSRAIGILPMAPLCLAFAALGTTVDVFGRLMFVPAAAATLLVTSGYLIDQRYRVAMVALAMGCILGPMALQWTGVVAPSTSWRRTG